MKRTIIAVIALLFCMVFGGACFAPTNATATTSEAYIPSETQAIDIQSVEIPLVETNDKNELLSLISSCEVRKNHAHEMAASGRALGYDETHPVVQLAQEEWSSANTDQQYYQQKYNEIIAAEEAKWTEKFNEYPTATTIWRYLKDLGYNDYVCAGIMGNLMAEVGGQTLDIQYWLTGNGYYGMCQWNKNYSDIWGGSLEEQLDYLRDTIKYEIDNFGFCYKNNFTYDSFLNLTNEKNAALAFAKSYERCGSGSYSVRQKNATKAYEYFVG